MFERLIDAIINFWGILKPAVIIPAYSEAIVLRLGKYKKTLEPGLHFKIPIADSIIEYYTVTTTINLPPQSLYVSKSKTNLVVKGIVKYRINDGKTFCLSVNAARDALADVAQGIIKQTITNLPIEKCFANTIDKILTQRVKTEAAKWGIEIQAVTLSDIAPIRSYRFLSEINDKPQDAQ